MKDVWEAYEEKLRSHDWYYMMSDDQRYYSAGRESAQEINAGRRVLSEFDKERADALYEKYVQRNY